MNQVETNLLLWAICSIILFEILCIVCLCRCCFNRIKPKKFYLKREEYDYLQSSDNRSRFPYPSTILRPPLADELALVGTIRAHNPAVAYGVSSFQNLGFYSDQTDESLPPPSASHWIELQPTMINTASLSPDDYLSIDPFRRPELILPPAAQRLDTSTGVYSANYPTPAPKSILKSNTTPPLNSFSTDSSKYDESPRTSVRINATPSIFLDYPDEPISSKHRMEFASFSQLNHVEWEIPSELQTIMCELSNDHPSDAGDEDVPNRPRTQSATAHVSRVFVPWEQTGKPPRFDEHRTQQQAFEY